jgi:sulfite reductase (ferredoxin)
MPKRKNMSTLSKVEHVKLESNYLRGTLQSELENTDDHFIDTSELLLKFHGIYQQSDRDIRKARKAQGLSAQHSFMIRVAIAGGVLTKTQYLELDDLSDQLANSTLRITTRQAIQYHGVLKSGLKPLLKTLESHRMTSLSACGDVVRNIVACPAPFKSQARDEIMAHAFSLSENLKPRARAYFEVWLDGEKAVTLEENEKEEPLYGVSYLPRKFKIAFAFPNDNCVDAYTQDVGIVPVMNGEQLVAFTLIVGGGLGQSHTIKDTHPRLGDPMTTIAPELLLETIKAIVTVQRDYGRRDDRKYSRMKYLVESMGIDNFKKKVEEVLGVNLPAPQKLEWTSGDDHLGWHEQGDGNWFLGLFIENGRIKDQARVGIRKAVEQYVPEVRLTPQQNMLLCNIKPQDKAALEALLVAHDIILPDSIAPVIKNSMACPAFPTCGLAITEAERALPELIREVQTLLESHNLESDTLAPHIRMTGCPNGCARPYSAEVGLVGRGVNSYAIYLGGSHLGTRLSEVFLDNIKREEMIPTLEPLFKNFKAVRLDHERFGDYCHRLGLENLRALVT